MVSTAIGLNQGAVLVIMRKGMRAGTHQRHVAPKDIEKLRQLVDTKAPQNCANTRHSRIVSTGLYDIRAVLMDTHRPEFEDHKWAGVDTRAALLEDYWAFAFKSDC